MKKSERKTHWNIPYYGWDDPQHDGKHYDRDVEKKYRKKEVNDDDKHATKGI